MENITKDSSWRLLNKKRDNKFIESIKSIERPIHLTNQVAVDKDGNIIEIEAGDSSTLPDFKTDYELRKKFIEPKNPQESKIDQIVRPYEFSAEARAIKFKFLVTGTIEWNGITLNCVIKNPNPNNYLQVDGSLDSLIEELIIVIDDDNVVERVEEYSTKYFISNMLSPDYKNTNLYTGSREVLLEPQEQGTSIIFNPPMMTMDTNSFYEIEHGKINLIECGYLDVSIPLKCRSFGNQVYWGKQKGSNLKSLEGKMVTVVIKINVDAFFVPVFNSSIQMLSSYNVSSEEVRTLKKFQSIKSRLEKIKTGDILVFDPNSPSWKKMTVVNNGETSFEIGDQIFLSGHELLNHFLSQNFNITGCLEGEDSQNCKIVIGCRTEDQRNRVNECIAHYKINPSNLSSHDLYKKLIERILQVEQLDYYMNMSHERVDIINEAKKNYAVHSLVVKVPVIKFSTNFVQIREPIYDEIPTRYRVFFAYYINNGVMTINDTTLSVEVLNTYERVRVDPAQNRNLKVFLLSESITLSGLRRLFNWEGAQVSIEIVNDAIPFIIISPLLAADSWVVGNSNFASISTRSIKIFPSNANSFNPFDIFERPISEKKAVMVFKILSDVLINKDVPDFLNQLGNHEDARQICRTLLFSNPNYSFDKSEYKRRLLELGRKLTDLEVDQVRNRDFISLKYISSNRAIANEEGGVGFAVPYATIAYAWNIFGVMNGFDFSNYDNSQQFIVNKIRSTIECNDENQTFDNLVSYSPYNFIDNLPERYTDIVQLVVPRVQVRPNIFQNGINYGISKLKSIVATVQNFWGAFSRAVIGNRPELIYNNNGEGNDFDVPTINRFKSMFISILRIVIGIYYEFQTSRNENIISIIMEIRRFYDDEMSNIIELRGVNISLLTLREIFELIQFVNATGTIVFFDYRVARTASEQISKIYEFARAITEKLCPLLELLIEECLIDLFRIIELDQYVRVRDYCKFLIQSASSKNDIAVLLTIYVSFLIGDGFNSKANIIDMVIEQNRNRKLFRNTNFSEIAFGEGAINFNFDAVIEEMNDSIKKNASNSYWQSISEFEAIRLASIDNMSKMIANDMVSRRFSLIEPFLKIKYKPQVDSYIDDIPNQLMIRRVDRFLYEGDDSINLLLANESSNGMLLFFTPKELVNIPTCRKNSTRGFNLVNMTFIINDSILWPTKFDFGESGDSTGNSRYLDYISKCTGTEIKDTKINRLSYAIGYSTNEFVSKILSGTNCPELFNNSTDLPFIHINSKFGYFNEVMNWFAIPIPLKEIRDEIGGPVMTIKVLINDPKKRVHEEQLIANLYSFE